jgi:hypothetical protein
MTAIATKVKDLKVGDVITMGPSSLPINKPERWFGYYGINDLRPAGTKPMVVLGVTEASWNPGYTGSTIVKYLMLQAKIVGSEAHALVYFDGENTAPLKTHNMLDTKETAIEFLKIMPAKTGSITCGADPEIFLRDAKTKQAIPAFTVLVDKKTAMKRGTEEVPYWDGFQAEFNTVPSGCLAYQVDSIARSLKNLVNAAKKTALPRHEVQLSSKTVINLHSSSFKDAKKEHIEFGCMPSYNAYGDYPNLAEGAAVPFRMAGGHLHFGWPETTRPTRERCETMVKSLDMILGVFTVALFHKYDDKRRRMLYGRAGEYRKPPHGLEYRVLSNAWLMHPVYAHLMFELARRCITVAGNTAFWEATEEETRDCINNCDLRLAKKLLMRNAGPMKAMLQSIARSETGAERLFKLAFDGADSILDTRRTLEDRWDVNGKWIEHSDGKGKNIITALPLILKNQMLG